MLISPRVKSTPIKSSFWPSRSLSTLLQEGLTPDLDSLVQHQEFANTPKIGLQHTLSKRKPPTEFNKSYNLNHPDLHKGQKCYLLDLCQIYSVKDMIKKKEQRYVQILERRKTTGCFYSIFINVYFFLIENFLRTS